MYTTGNQDNWVKQIAWCAVFVGVLSATCWGVSQILCKMNSDRVKSLTTNNLQLVKDNRELREQNKQLTQQLSDRNRRLGQIKTAMEGYQ